MNPAGFIFIAFLLFVAFGLYLDHRSDRMKVRAKNVTATQARLTAAENLIDAIREEAYNYDEIDHPLASKVRQLISDYKASKGIKK